MKHKLYEIFDIPQSGSGMTRLPPKPITRTDEVDQLARQIQQTTSQSVMMAALTWNYTYTMLSHYAVEHGVAMDALIDLQREALHLWIERAGISSSEVLAALESLQRAGETAKYLHSLPD